jgi:hypothetical protein
MSASLRFLNALTKLLAGISVYGFVPCDVNRRSREVGIRMALATNNLDTTMPVQRNAMRPVALGAPFALACAGILSMNLSAAIFVRLSCGIGLPGPVSFLLVPGFLLSVALLASYVPARRATQVDPRLALRPEWV